MDNRHREHVGGKGTFLSLFGDGAVHVFWNNGNGFSFMTDDVYGSGIGIEDTSVEKGPSSFF